MMRRRKKIEIFAAIFLSSLDGINDASGVVCNMAPVSEHFIMRSISLLIWIKLCLFIIAVAANLECIQQIIHFELLERYIDYLYELMIPLHWLVRFFNNYMSEPELNQLDLLHSTWIVSLIPTILIVEMNCYFGCSGCFVYQALLIHSMKLFLALNMTRIYLPRFFGVCSEIFCFYCCCRISMRTHNTSHIHAGKPVFSYDAHFSISFSLSFSFFYSQSLSRSHFLSLLLLIFSRSPVCAR